MGRGRCVGVAYTVAQGEGPKRESSLYCVYVIKIQLLRKSCVHQKSVAYTVLWLILCLLDKGGWGGNTGKTELMRHLF